MSELAFNQNGDSFEIPAGATGWRVRRMKPRGAPELVYGKDGRPLVIPIEADMDDLREAVVQTGRYRLDPVNDDNKVIESVPAAYIQVVRAERNAPPAEVATREEPDGAVREAMRLNTELARTVVEQFPSMMTAAAELLRAADGAGLPARAPRILDAAEADELADETAALPARGGLDIAALLQQLAPLAPLAMAFFGGKGIDAAALFDWRKATPGARETPRASVERKKAVARVEPSQIAPSALVEPATETSEAFPPLDPQTMAHFIAIQSALAPDEAALAREVAGDLSRSELHAWFDELSNLSVADAVIKIRALIAGPKATTGGAS